MRHTVVERDWAKVYVWDIAAYDANGPYGSAPAPKSNPHIIEPATVSALSDQGIILDDASI